MIYWPILSLNTVYVNLFYCWSCHVCWRSIWVFLFIHINQYSSKVVEKALLLLFTKRNPKKIHNSNKLIIIWNIKLYFVFLFRDNFISFLQSLNETEMFKFTILVNCYNWLGKVEERKGTKLVFLIMRKPDILPHWIPEVIWYFYRSFYVYGRLYVIWSCFSDKLLFLYPMSMCLKLFKFAADHSVTL